ncbi:MAG: hypothetical protein ACE5F1_11870 [Planctomycetota bacterium]
MAPEPPDCFDGMHRVLELLEQNAGSERSRWLDLGVLLIQVWMNPINPNLSEVVDILHEIEARKYCLEEVEISAIRVGNACKRVFG